MTTATNSGAAYEKVTGPLSEDEAAEELLKRFLPQEQKGEAAKKPASKKTEEDTEETADPETTDDDKGSAEKPETEGDETEDEGAGEEAEKKFAEDGAYFKIKVGEEEHQVPISQLARLYGQEASLTKKSMEVAEQRKAAEAELTKTAASNSALLERARARFEPFSKLDFHLLAAQLQPEEYSQLRQSAQAAWEDVQFLEKHQDGFVKAIQERQQTELRARAKECRSVLEGPADKGGIEGWDENLYNEVRAYAISEGANADVINQLVDPWAFRLLHNAMQFARGRSKDKGTVVVKKVNKTPKKITKTTNSPVAAKSDGKTADVKKAEDKFRRSGKPDDAAELLMARWAKEVD